MSEQQNEADNPPAEAAPAPIEQPREKSGRFAPKPKPQPSPETPPEPSTGVQDALLTEIETDLREALKGKMEFKEIEDLDQRMRVRMLRIFAKNLGSKEAKKEAVDPTTPPPPVEEHIPTLAELNRVDKYMADVRKERSIMGFAAKIRGQKE